MDGIVASPLVKSFLAGSLSGTCSTLLFQPLDLVKTRLQAATSVSRSEEVSMLKTMRMVIKNDKVLGLWSGFKPSVYRCVPGVGMYFSTLHTLKSHFFNDSIPSPSQSLLLGASSRTFAATILIPLTVVKTRFESGTFKYTGTCNALHSIYTCEGRRGLSAGLSATLIRDAPFSGLYLMFYNYGKTFVPEEAFSGKDGAFIHFSIGIAAGICASVMTQPADVIKTQMQLSKSNASIRRTAEHIYESQGMEGFFRGLAPRVLRRTLIAAMAWTVYEEIMKSLDLKT